MSPTYWVFAVSLFPLGLTALTVITTANAYVQTFVDAQMRGRVTALYLMVFMGGTPAGAPMIGWLAEVLGPRWSMLGGGLLTAAGTLLVAVVFARRDGIIVRARLRPRAQASRSCRLPDPINRLARCRSGPARLLGHETQSQQVRRPVRADGERMAAVAEHGLDLPVPSCPGWTVRDAVEHTAEVFLHKVACMREKAFPDPWPPERGAEPTIPYLRNALDALIGELTNRDEYEFAETWWWDERTVGFWGRRMAHEAAIHRVDVELAHDDVTPVDGELALDGVDEVLRRFLAGDWSDEEVSDSTADRDPAPIGRDDLAGRDGAHGCRRERVFRSVAGTTRGRDDLR